MKKILSKNDLDALRKSIPMPSALYTYLQNRFLEFQDRLTSDDQDPGTFPLRDHGCLVLLQPHDDLTSLDPIGLHSFENGLFGSIPEVITEQNLPDLSIYHVHILCNNVYMLELIIPKDIIDRYPEGKSFIERWI